MAQYASYSGYGGSGGGGGGGVTSVNGAVGPSITISAGTGISVGTLGNTITVTNTQSAFTPGNLTDAGTDGIIVTGGTNAVNGAGTSIAQHVADSTHNGYLSSTDWLTFNAKQPAGSYATTTLNNLGTTSINASLLFNADLTYDLGSITNHLANVYTGAIKSNGGPLSITGNTVSVGSSGSFSVISTFVDVNTVQIHNVVDPTSAQDAATKNYVDTHSGTGTVTSVSVVSANGLAGTVATATTTPAITLSTTITGILQGNGTAISAATTGNLTDAGTDGIVIIGGTGAVLGSGTSLAQHVADTTHNGYLSSTDWNTFNGKQASGNYITALTGDVTASGPGSVSATLATVNGNVGSFGSSTSIPSFTVNGKGLITAASGNAVVAPAGTLTGTTLASNVVTSSLTSFGSLVSPLTLSQISTPSSPASGFDKIYFKSDNNAYILDSSGNENLLTSTASSAVWSGYHSSTNGNSWSRSSTSFGDFSNASDASVTLTQVNNNNFGTVTGYGASSGTSALPGIVFTPPATGMYFVKASFAFNQDADNNQFIGLRLQDNTGNTTIDESGVVFAGSQVLLPVTLSGIINYTTLSSKTISLQAQSANAGTVFIDNLIRAAVAQGTSIEWTIFQITGNPGISSTSMRYFSSSTTISSSLATIVYATQDYDTAAAYSAGVYTVPLAGKYQVNAGLLTNGTIALNTSLIMEIQKNSSVISRSTENAAGAISQFNNQISDTINCAAGDTLRIQASSTAIAPAIVSSNFDNFLSIIKIN